MERRATFGAQIVEVLQHTKCATPCVNGCTKKTRKTRPSQSQRDHKGFDRGEWWASKRRKAMVGDAHGAKIAQLEAKCELYENKIKDMDTVY